MGQKLGQHFLIDNSVLERTRDAIQACLPDSKTPLIEIGPGQGALTKYIYQLSEQFLCMEKDESMKKYLGQFLEMDQVVWGDVLEIEINPRPQAVPLPYQGGSLNSLSSTIVVGNLPYYITSPILRKFFVDGQALGGVFLIQKEVADKLKTDAKKKSYLRWLVNYGYDVEYLFTVPPEAFAPPPKVQSSVIKITSQTLDSRKKTLEKAEEGRESRVKNLESHDKAFSLDRLTSFLDVVSPYSRKTLGKIAKMKQDEFQQLGIFLPEELQKKRLEELNWVQLAAILK